MSEVQAPDVNELAYARGVFGYGNRDGGSSRYADHGSNAARVTALGQRMEDQADCSRGILTEGFHSLGGQLDSATRERQINSLHNELFQSELRGRDQADANYRETSRQISELKDNQHHAEVEAAKQFGDLKAGQAAIDAKIDANQRFNELFAENQALKTQVACGCTTGCSTPCGG